MKGYAQKRIQFRKLLRNRESFWIKFEFCRPGSKGSTSLPEDFTSDLVSDLTKETCRNWFYKIASIRELVPRIYVEMAILKSYNFVTTRYMFTTIQFEQVNK